MGALEEDLERAVVAVGGGTHGRGGAVHRLGVDVCSRVHQQLSGLLTATVSASIYMYMYMYIHVYMRVHVHVHVHCICIKGCC